MTGSKELNLPANLSLLCKLRLQRLLLQGLKFEAVSIFGCPFTNWWALFRSYVELWWHLWEACENSCICYVWDFIWYHTHVYPWLQGFGIHSHSLRIRATLSLHTGPCSKNMEIDLKQFEGNWTLEPRTLLWILPTEMVLQNRSSLLHFISWFSSLASLHDTWLSSAQTNLLVQVCSISLWGLSLCYTLSEL